MQPLKLTRPPMQRMWLIHEQLRRQVAVTCTKLATLTEMSRKTLYRDVRFMVERLGLPIEFDRSQNTYRYTRPVRAFPTLQVSEGDMVAMLVAQQAIEQYRGTPYHPRLETAFAKLTASLQDRISFKPGKGLSAVSFKNTGIGRTDLKLFDLVSRAVLREREVRFDYRKPGSQETTARHVQPYHLANRDNLWYLVGFDREKMALRTFALPRMARATALATRFKRPEDFSPEEYFASALGVMGGEGNYHVVIRFRGAAADRVREREWHESQSMRELPGGELELSLHLGALPEVLRWVLSWGADAQVLEPKELRDQARDAGRGIAALYNDIV